MEFSKLADLGEFIGGIAVLLTLVYLAVQIRQGNTRAQADTELKWGHSASEVSAFITADAELCELWRRGLQGRDTLDKGEEFRLKMLLATMFFRFEAMFLQYQRGLLSAEVWSSWEQYILNGLGNPTGKQWWRTGRFPCSREFREYVDALVARNAG